MSMAGTALAANNDRDSFRQRMNANRWWFTMAHDPDGRFDYQPNLSNSGYASNLRMTASSALALIFTISRCNLVITGQKTL